MTIRRFMVLVRGLGPNSATLVRHLGRGYIGSARGGVVRETASRQESENVLAAMFGLPAKRVS